MPQTSQLIRGVRIFDKIIGPFEKPLEGQDIRRVKGQSKTNQWSCKNAVSAFSIDLEQYSVKEGNGSRVCLLSI